MKCVPARLRWHLANFSGDLMIKTESDRDRQDALSRIAATFSAGDFYQAEQIARQLYQADAADEEALHLLTQIIYRQGRPAEAIDLMSDLIGLNPMHAPYHNDLGVMQASLGQWPEASAAYRMSIVLDPSGGDARFNLALALFRQADPTGALTVLDDLALRAPVFAEQYALRGEILRAQKQHEAAAAAFSQALELGVRTADVYSQLGMALSDGGRKDDALSALLEAGQIDSDDPAANYYLGNLLREQGKFDAAVLHYRKALARHPDFAEVYNNLGLILQEQGDVSGAEAAFARALALAPGLGAAHVNMGNWQIKQGHMEAALLCFRKAVEMTPDSAEAWNNLGEACYRLQRLDEAEEAYRKALAINPGCAEAGLNLGILLLLRGDFAAGWPYYEQRWEMPAVRANRPRFAQPEWSGETLEGKALLIYVEQGMGDNLQFVRYLGVLRARYPGAKIYYWCLPPLFELFSSYAEECGVELLPETVPGGLPPFDYQIALLTLPGRLGTTLETIPAAVPYLKAPQNLVDQWAARLAGLPGKKVGLVWASGETYLFHKFRTMRLEQLSPLLQIPGISWVSLQKGGGAVQISEEGWSGRIFDPMGEVNDFSGTAAIIANLDLVISVDTSVPHLAGAMGKPVWLLDRFDTDWRWLLGRSDSPWYPTMRIFRQTKFGDWAGVVSAVVRDLGGDCSAAAALSGKREATHADFQGATFGGENIFYKIVHARHGWMLANSNDYYIGRALIEYGEYNEIEAEFLSKLMIRPGRIIEVGANIGSHTVGLAKLAAIRGEQLEAFEPQPVIFQNLCANLALNGLTNVLAWPFACANQDGFLYFEVPNYGVIGNFGGVGLSANKVGNENKLRVKCVRLDDAINQDNPISLIKVDVEGFELDVLKGGVDIIKKWQPVLYVENDRVEQSKDLIEWLWGQGYSLYWHIPNLYNPDNYFGALVNRFGSVASFNMLCLPEGENAQLSGVVRVDNSSHHPLRRD